MSKEQVAAIPAENRAPSEQNISPLMVLHERYEQATNEYGLVERAERAARQNDDEYHSARYQTALRASAQETDALRIAILHQVPDNWTEAMVLQFHIANAFDMQANSDGSTPDHEQEALQTAIDTLFDFMCCEVQQDHDKIGPAFKAGASRVFLQRRYRTGDVEG